MQIARSSKKKSSTCITDNKVLELCQLTLVSGMFAHFYFTQLTRLKKLILSRVFSGNQSTQAYSQCREHRTSNVKVFQTHQHQQLKQVDNFHHLPVSLLLKKGVYHQSAA